MARKNVNVYVKRKFPFEYFDYCRTQWLFTCEHDLCGLEGEDYMNALRWTLHSDNTQLMQAISQE